MSQVETSRVQEEGELDAFARCINWCFGIEENQARARLERVARSDVRLARSEGRLLGGLVEVPMGQWFGGASVPTLGLAGVAVAPEARGRGVALALVTDALSEARARGLRLSTLYPSNYGLYRRAGYELAGTHCRFTLQLRSLGRPGRSLAVEEASPDDTAIEALHREVVRHRTGQLDRGPYVWDRVRRPRGLAARAFAARRGSELEGYVYLRPAESPSSPLELSLSDWVAKTPAAYQTLLGFLADHATTADRATFHGGALDPRVLALPAPAVAGALREHWMLRIVDVAGALEQRGYPPVDAAVTLEVADPLLPDNTGAFALEVRQGVARVGRARGGRGVRLDVGALAALFSGAQSPWELQLAGRLEGEDASLGALALLFAGPAPEMADFF